MLSIIKWGLLARRWSTIWWCIGIVSLIGINVLLYPSFRDQSAQLEQSFSQIPEAAKALFTDTGDFLSPVGYLSSQIYYLMLPLILSILTISMGSSLVTKEEQEGTLELLLSRPISRTKLISAKALVAFIIISTVTIVTTISTLIFASIAEIEVGLDKIALATLLSAILSVLFGIIAFCLSAFGGFGRSISVSIAALVAFGSYIISSLGEVVSWLSGVAKFLPFNYYQPAEVMYGTYNWRYAGVFVLIIIALFIISIIGFRKRDIKN